MPHDVFISHSTRDKAIADRITSFLEANAIRCWIAPRDIRPGRDWAEAIVEAIGESKLMVLIFSESANTSPQISREISVASNHDVPVIPFRIENVEPSKKLQYYLSTPHWIDAFQPSIADNLAYLTSSIRSMLPEMAEAGEESTGENVDAIVEKVSFAGSETIKKDVGIERYFTFNEQSEPISERAKLIWILLTMFSCFAMIAGFSAVTSALEASSSGASSSSVAWTLNLRTGLLIILGWSMAFFARTHPIYGYFAGFMASATLCFFQFLSLWILGYEVSEKPYWTSGLVELIIISAIISGAFLRKPFLWIYAACVSTMPIFSSVYYWDLMEWYLLLPSVIQLSFVIYILVIHRKRNLLRLETK